MKRALIAPGGNNKAPFGQQHDDGEAAALKYAKPKRMDTGLLIVVLILLCFGMLMLFSASMTEGFTAEQNAMFFIKKQLIFTILGFIAALVIAALIPIRFFDRFWLILVLYIGMSVLLMMIFVRPANPVAYGVVINGARRWIRVVGFQFQPSELAKILMVFCYAGYASWKKHKRENGELVTDNPIFQPWKDGILDVVVPVTAYGVWALLVILQPHISWVIISGLMMFFLLFATKIPLKSWICGIIVLLVIGIVVVGVFYAITPLLPESLQNYVNYDYALRRIAIFTDPAQQDSDALLQITQSINAIGSGGLFGVGPGNSIQKWGYLPMQYNDYVFSIIAEELGFIGAMSIICLFLTFLIMGVRTALKAANEFSMLIAFGISVVIPLQALLNIGVAIGALPPTGISLPFFSYGGSSTTFFLIGIGFLLSVSKFGVRRTKRGDL